MIRDELVQFVPTAGLDAARFGGEYRRMVGVTGALGTVYDTWLDGVLCWPLAL